MIYNNAPTSKGDAFGPSTLRIGSKGIEVYNLQVILWENNCLGDRKTMNACDGVVWKCYCSRCERFPK